MPGEHLIDGVVREVLEETGVQAAFEALVCFRHWHGYRWNKSDIYFICRLSALSEEITAQANEIEEAKWMPVDEYLASEYRQPVQQTRRASRRCKAREFPQKRWTATQTRTASSSSCRS